ncbi:YqgE/AlgH family protein [Deltaproteobacteria bacterium TL4]
MENNLIPGLLIALPTLKDPYFEKTVILMINYTKEGAFGIIVNTSTSTRVKDIIANDIEDKAGFDIPVLIGGPVQPEAFWAVHSTDYWGKTTTKISDNIAISAAQDVLQAIANDRGPKICHIGCGYAGWGAEQLDNEISNESWWLGPLDESLVLNLPYAERWETTLKNFGLDLLTSSFVKTGSV